MKITLETGFGWFEGNISDVYDDLTNWICFKKRTGGMKDG